MLSNIDGQPSLMTKYICNAFIGIGANLPGLNYITPRATCEAAVKELLSLGINIESQSSWYRSAPVPTSDQPWFINGIISTCTSLEASALINVLHDVERKFGRARATKNAARTLDLDLIAYANMVSGWKRKADDSLIIPHPRMHERGFVLLPLHEIAPDWCHPVFMTPIEELIAKLDPSQKIIVDDEETSY